MNEIEQRAVKALVEVRLPPDTWHQKFVRRAELKLASDPLWGLSCEEQADLWYLAWRYRRQIADAAVVARADEIVNGALGLRF